MKEFILIVDVMLKYFFS